MWLGFWPSHGTASLRSQRSNPSFRDTARKMDCFAAFAMTRWLWFASQTNITVGVREAGAKAPSK